MSADGDAVSLLPKGRFPAESAGLNSARPRRQSGDARWQAAVPRTQSRLKVDTKQESLSLMATEAIEENPENVSRPTTAGMTTRVVKGSLWTLAGQVAPLGVSLFTTPFTIRLLGAESYGVLILIGLIQFLTL